MSSVQTQGGSGSSVVQIVYEAVFENNEEFRRIAEEKAAKRRAEEAARAEASRKQAADAVANTSSPSVIVDVSSADTSVSAPAPTAAPAAKTVDLVA